MTENKYEILKFSKNVINQIKPTCPIRPCLYKRSLYKISLFFGNFSHHGKTAKPNMGTEYKILKISSNSSNYVFVHIADNIIVTEYTQLSKTL